MLERIRDGGDHLNNLRQYLAARDWRKADWETKLALMEAVEKKKFFLTLTPDDIKEISFSRLSDIDRAWSKADKRFGLKKQCSILNRHGYNEFVQRVGWRTNGGWKSYDDLFSSRLFCEGQFPYIGKFFWERICLPESLAIQGESVLSERNNSDPFERNKHLFDRNESLRKKRNFESDQSSQKQHQGKDAEDDDFAAIAAAAAPWLLLGGAAAAAVGVGGYMLYRNMTKNQREERKKREKAEQKAEQENQIKNQIVSALKSVEYVLEDNSRYGRIVEIPRINL
ncbi:MAG: GUN4 domain-containing protein [Hormoscilla sp. GM7CHS1pb]|nr:GUN4 domain-containing protein [Hormoscilla sp. GM7CHS1pb]